ncbi:MAG: hypothetical protein B6D38_10005 [Anaerolineae bacterium UTCFX1]|jgi:poly(3-hydroxybutyrate) depolymerase|nr:MAG: hypothetical protein B6D38_10005 [Anaerolineae bacterium UTCFX1]
MKNKNLLAALLIVMTLITACRFNRPAAGGGNPTGQPNAPATASVPSSAPEPQIQSLQFTTGRNDYVIEVDNTPREFIVYVPGGYDPNAPTPVVFMFHGSNQSGNIMYENTDWVNKAEEENFLVVFPTAWKYKLIGEPGMQEKWNSAKMREFVEPGTKLKDDVKFTRAVLETLEATFNVDTTRLYATGFSNGGGFVLTRLIPEMNDVFAAYSTSGAGLYGEAALDVIPTGITASLYSVLGTNDNKIAERTGIPLPFPIVPEEIFGDPIFNTMLTNAATLLSLDTAYQAERDDRSVIMTFDSSLVGADNQFIFRMVKGLFHVYPSGDNNPMNLDMTPVFWEFFMQYHK